jgi:DNA-directed RNA polymerase subunit omega
LNAELLGQAAEKIGNPNILVNLVSRRVRQLIAGSRPLFKDTAHMGAADIALHEIVFGQMGWEAIPDLPGETTPSRRRKRG